MIRKLILNCRSLSAVFILGMSVSLPLSAEVDVASLLDARVAFETEIVREANYDYTFPTPPEAYMSIVRYPTPIGAMSAYLSKPRIAGEKYPAIIWLTGGFPVGGGSESQWRDHPRSNDQSAQSYWRSGVITLYPSLRGTYGNPGEHEGFFGEVNDVIAARDYLASLEMVDAKRIYLGGHSTGGTLALLVATATDAFAGVFAFGPVADPSKAYGSSNMRHDTSKEPENRLRAPIHYLKSIKSPTYVIEGKNGNYPALTALQKAGKYNRNLHFIAVPGADHFDVLQPVNAVIAEKLMREPIFELTVAEAQAAYEEVVASDREIEDIKVLAQLRYQGTQLTGEHVAQYYFTTRDQSAAEAALKAAVKVGFKEGELMEAKGKDGKQYFMLRLDKKTKLSNLETVFSQSAQLDQIAKQYNLTKNSWFIKK